MTDPQTAPPISAPTQTIDPGVDAGPADFDFGYLDLTTATAEFELPYISPDAVIVCKPAHSSNKPYQSAMLKLGSDRPRGVAVSAENVQEMEEQQRADDAELFPGLVVIEMRGVFNRHGQLVPSTVENIRALLKQLLVQAPWMLDRIRGFCLRPQNFVRKATLPPHAGEVAGKS